MRRGVTALLVLVLIGAAAWVAYQYWSGKNQQSHQPVIDRRPELRKQIVEQEAESAQAVAKYRPSTTAQITELDIPAADILRGLPGVIQVEVLAKADKPSSRIIHFRDWHFVPKELLAIDMAEAYGRSLSRAEIDLLHEQHLLEVELVQLEQMAILRCLIKHHGLRRVFSEGFSEGELENYRDRIAVLRSMENEQIPQLRKQLADVRRLIDGASEEGKKKAQEIEAELVNLLDGHKHRLLEMGAAGRLLIAGELEDVLPLENAAALEKAKPITPSGGVKLDPEKIEARHDAQVRAVLKERPVAVIILGGSHDLTGAVQRSGGGKCEYLRLTMKRYKEIGD